MFQRHFSTFLITIYSLFCLVCLSWSADSAIRTLKHTCFYLLSPASFPLVSQMEKWGAFGENMSRLLSLDRNYRELEEKWQRQRLDEKRLQALELENQRLNSLLNMQPLPGYEPLAARILTRDSNDWFRSFLVDRGERDGVTLSDPVVALQDGREVFVGQIIEAFDKKSRVLLVTDPLSSVSASVSRTREQGAVEGQGTDWLVLNYLFSDSDVQPGDEVMTAGLGQVFPEGIFLGTVERAVEASQESFKKAYLKPAARLNRLEEILILRKKKPISP